MGPFRAERRRRKLDSAFHTAERLEARRLLSDAPIGNEFEVTRDAQSHSTAPSIGANLGGSVVAWQEYSSITGRSDIYARRYDTAGVALAPAFQVNVGAAGNQTTPSVAVDSSGNFQVVWEGGGVVGADIFGRRYSSSGAALGSEFVVNNLTTGDQVAPAIATGANGDFVVAWKDWGPGSQVGVYFRRYASSGVAYDVQQKAPMTADYGLGTARDRVGLSANLLGDFVIASAVPQPANNMFSDIVAAKYTAGSSEPVTVTVNTVVMFRDADLPSVAIDSAGAFGVAWEGLALAGDGLDAYARWFDPAATPAGPEVIVNQTTAGDQSATAIATDPAGNFVVSWQGPRHLPAKGRGIYGRRYSFKGIAQGSEFEIDTAARGSHQRPSVSLDSRGDLFAAWADYCYGYGSYSSIYSRYLQQLPSRDLLTYISYDGQLADASVSGPNAAKAINVRPSSLFGVCGIVKGAYGLIYALTDSTAGSFGLVPNALYSLNLDSGKATLIGATGLTNIFEGDLTFDPDTLSLYGSFTLDQSNHPQLFKVDTFNGKATVVGPFTSGFYVPFDVSALTIVPGSAVGKADKSVIIGLDTQFNSPAVLFQSDLFGNITSVASVGKTLGVTAGMTYNPENGQTYVADGSTFASLKLNTIDLLTGKLTEIGSLGADFPNGVSGLTFAGVDNEPSAAPLARDNALGSTVQSATLTGAIDVPGDVDAFDVRLAAGQFITLHAAVFASALVTLQARFLDCGGQILSTTTAAPGGGLMMQAQAPTDGAYRLVLRDVAGGTGHYQVDFNVNAAFENENLGGASNDTKATAQDLSPTFTALGAPNTGITRGAVTGSIGPAGPKLLAGDNFESGALDSKWTRASSDANGRIYVSTSPPPAQGGDALYLDRSTAGGPTLNEATWTVNLGGAASPIFSFYQADFGDIAVPLPADFTGSVNGDGVSISSDGGVNWHRIFNPPIQTSGAWVPYSIDLGAQAKGAGMTLGPNFRIKFQQYGSNRIGKTDGRGFDDLKITDTLVPEDWYSLSVQPYDYLSLNLSENTARDLTLSIYDALDHLVATSVPGGSQNDIIRGVALPQAPAGPYFVRVVNDAAGSQLGASYTLSITRNTGIDAEPNSTNATAQSLDSTGRALGYVQGGAAPDEDWYKFDVAAGQPILAGLSIPYRGFERNGNLLSAGLELFDPAGIKVAASDPAERPAALAFTAPAAGTYRLHVSALSDSAGEYLLSTSDFPGLSASPASAYSLTGPQNAKVFSVTGGLVNLSIDLSSLYPGINVNVAGGAALTFNSDEHLGALTLSGGATASVTSRTGNRLLVTNSLSIDSTSRLDLQNNDMILRAPTTGGLRTPRSLRSGGVTRLSSIESLIARGFNNGDWNGTGLTSSFAAGNPNFTTALGSAAAADIGVTTFDGQSVASGDVLVKYTYYGDADLSGSVTGDDESLLLFGLRQGGGPHWAFGDFDYSSHVNGDDYSLFLAGLRKPIVL